MRYVAANRHPDHDTIAHFRKRFLPELSALFVQILAVAHQMGVVKLGTVSLDGTKVQANASKHRALSWEHAGTIEAQLRAEVAQLLQLAAQADAADLPDGMCVPDELKRRDARLAAIAAGQGPDRSARGRAARAGAGGLRAEDGGAHGADAADRPQAARVSAGAAGASPGPRPKDQVNLTDPDSRIMPTGKGFVQAYNAQAAVDVRDPADRGAAREPARERQAGNGAGAGAARRGRARDGPTRRAARRYRLLQRGERRGVPHARHRAVHRQRAGGALSAAGRAAARARAAAPRRRARSIACSIACARATDARSTRNANAPSSRPSASSSRCSGSASFCSAGCRPSDTNGRSCASAGT